MTKTVNRLIIRGDGSFRVDPNGDWVSAQCYDEALVELARRSDIIGRAAALLDTHRPNDARDVLREGFADEPEKP